MVDAHPVDTDFYCVTRDARDTFAEMLDTTGAWTGPQIFSIARECPDGGRQTHDDDRAASHRTVDRMIHADRNARTQINPDEREDSSHTVHETLDRGKTSPAARPRAHARAQIRAATPARAAAPHRRSTVAPTAATDARRSHSH